MKSSTQSRLKENQNFWNILFSLFFILVLSLSIWLIYILRGGFPNSISLFDVVLIILTAFRITRLVVYDKVTRFFRELFVQKKEFTKDGKVWVELLPYTQGFRATCHELLTCPWCIGIWSALITVFAYFAWTWSWYVILFLAVAGVSSFIQILANAIGWKAENLKLDALEKEKQ